MNVLVCDDDRQVVDSVIESLKHQIEETNTASKFYGFSQPKAAEATRKKINIDFEVNDLSKLPFDASDMVVLLSNLLDNAIEACQQYEKEDKTIHVTAIAQQAFFISIRNTSKPVVILNDSIPTTKPEPQLHGFGLVNIHLILEKYHGEHTMFYENGWFQFTADIPFTPIS